jgi:hypothetical protein
MQGLIVARRKCAGMMLHFGKMTHLFGQELELDLQRQIPSPTIQSQVIPFQQIFK